MRVLVVCSYPKNIGHALGAGSGKTHGTVGGERSRESGNTNPGLRRVLVVDFRRKEAIVRWVQQ